MAMLYELDDEQRELIEMVKDFVKKELPWSVVRKYDESGEFPMEIYKKAVEMGLTTLTIPEQYGGQGMSHYLAAHMMEELGKGDAGFATTVAANELAYTPVALAGTDEQKSMFTSYLNQSGGAGAFCLTEAEAGSDAGATRTRAVKDGDDYILNGSKIFITNGGIANVYTVFASTNPSRGPRGITAFIVERDRKGVSVGKEEDKMGIRLSNTAEVVFEDVRVPAKNILTGENRGYKLAMDTLDITRPCGGAAAVGICQAAIDYCVEYAKTRKTFGQPIFSNQAIQFMLADMEIQTQAARALTMKAAQLIDSGTVDQNFSSVTKTFVSDTAVKVAMDAIQIYGGYGYSREYPIEILVRNAKIFQIFEGTNQIQRGIIARKLHTKR